METFVSVVKKIRYFCVNLCASLAAFADLRSFYLFIYNMFMWIGYSYVFIAIIVRYIRDGEGNHFTHVPSSESNCSNENAIQ